MCLFYLIPSIWAKLLCIVRMVSMEKTGVSQTARQAVIASGSVINGHFIFADGDHATTKIEIDRLWDNPKSLKIILELLAKADGLPPADVIIGVPRGGQLLAQAIVPDYLDISIARLERIPGGAKQDYRFVSTADETLAKNAQSIRIYEDVVTTLSSIAGVVRLLDPTHQTIHSLAIWRRGEVKAKYHQGITDHYLVEEPVESFAAADCPVCNK